MTRTPRLIWAAIGFLALFLLLMIFGEAMRMNQIADMYTPAPIPTNLQLPNE